MAANPSLPSNPYAAAARGAALFDASGRGRILFTGPDHLDFLHRMSTNAIAGSAVGRGLETVFCDPRGRIVQVAGLSRTAEEETTAFVEDAPGLLDWLERYRFSERMEWADITGVTGQIELLGPAAAEVARSTLEAAPGESVATLSPGGPLLGMRRLMGGAATLRLWGPRAETEECRRRLLAAGAAELDARTWEILRVEWGLPAAGRELTLDHNPWEAGLGDAVHMDKGCYIGQEVVARLDTYQKVKQHLVGLRPNREIRPGAQVEAGGRPSGVVTSSVSSPRLGLLALAYVRTPHCRPGTLLSVDGTAAVVSALPFDPDRRPDGQGR